MKRKIFLLLLATVLVNTGIYFIRRHNYVRHDILFWERSTTTVRDGNDFVEHDPKGGSKHNDSVFKSKMEVRTGTGNMTSRESENKKGIGPSETSAENRIIYAGTNPKDLNKVDDTHQKRMNISRVVYNVDILIKELKRIHDRLYTKPSGETCAIRPAGCVIIGVAKSGTQELLDFLSLHPNVVPKHNLPNPNLFDKDSHTNKNKEQMPCTYSDQIGIVKTDYFFFREDMPDKFHKFNKDLKMILLVREPVERLISAYSFTFLQNKQHKLVFNYVLKDVPKIDDVFVDHKTGKVKTEQFDLAHSVYDIPMERYLNYFSREQILVIESKEFKDDPVTVLQRVEIFLGLKPVISNDFLEFNDKKHFYCLKVQTQLICYGSDRGRAQLKDIKPETRQKLYEYFKPHNEKFFHLIGQKFNWTSNNT